MRLIALLSLLAVAPLWAGETVVLRNGFQVRAERHEAVENGIRLYLEIGRAHV